MTVLPTFQTGSNGHVGPKGKAIQYEQLRCINLAKQGMLALHPEWLVFGELGDLDYKHNRLAYLDLCGLSGLSVFYLAMRSGLDVLLDQAATDTQRLAMTGLSGGGWQTIILGSLDKRLSLLVPNAGYIGLDQRVAHRSDIGDLEQNPTDLVSIADYTHLTAMLAPRPTLLIYNEKDDCCFVSERAKPSVFDPIVPFYRLFDRETDFEFYENTNPGTHNYDRDNRQQFYRFIHHHFLPDAPIGEEIPSETELLNPDQLEMGLPEDNANFFTLAQAQLSSLPKNRPPTVDLLAVQKWQEKARSRLLNLLNLKPMRSKAIDLRRASHGELEATWYRLTVGEAWSISALVVSKASPQTTVITFADAGRATMEGLIKEQIEAGSRVIAVDPLFMGECTPKGAAPSHYAMMIGTVGERPLGIQVGQIDAVVKWAYQQYGGQPVYLHSSGWTAEAFVGDAYRRCSHGVSGILGVFAHLLQFWRYIRLFRSLDCRVWKRDFFWTSKLDILSDRNRLGRGLIHGNRVSDIIYPHVPAYQVPLVSLSSTRLCDGW